MHILQGKNRDEDVEIWLGHIDHDVGVKDGQ